MTPRQKQLLDYITAYTDDHGFAPTVREIERELKINSRSAVYDHLTALEECGLIVRFKARKRGIEVINRLIDQNTFRDFIESKGLQEEYKAFLKVNREKAA